MDHISRWYMQQLSFAYREDTERKGLLKVQVEKDHPKYKLR